ncbi:serine/threonine-protein phosphatase 6 regulatory ankyrin repeat subunit B-like [Littorina saxatilis]|uniref:serine/threonine-protein phosphatase 6 regulatory ankyrin repeat subunit B-like n=1 Tax=Littorina saxatilis TaxID=31220 RepID=UPI0038B5379D
MTIGNLSGPVNFGGPQEIAINNTNNNIGQQNSTYIRKQVTKQYFISQNCSSCHDSGTVSETEADNETLEAFSADIHDVSPEDVSRGVELLDQNRRVALCGPPGSGRSSLGHAILTHYHHKGFKAYLVSKLCCQCQQSFFKKKQTVILLDGGLGDVRLDNDQYYRCQDLINNTQCLLVLTVYPHLLRDMAVLENRRPLLPSSLVICPNNICTPFALDYLPLFLRMLHDTHTGRLVAAVFALSMLGSNSLESDPPVLTSDLERLGFHSVDHYHLKQLAYNFRGSILPEIGPGFASRVLYDAAGLALGSLHSRSVLLQVCDVPFLVQHVRTSGTPGEPHVVIGSTDRERLMQRMYKTIVDGQLSEMCQHPLLECPDFLRDFQDFLTHRKNYVQQLLNAVDRKNGLSLLNWFLCSPSVTLTYWCLDIMIKHRRDGNVLSESLISAATAPILFPHTIKDAAKRKFRTFLEQAIHLKLKPEDKNNLTLSLLFPELFPMRHRSFAKLKKSLHTQGLCYLDDLSLPIPATLLSVTVAEDAVSVELPSQHWYLALRLLADREVDETDRDGNTLLHIAADKGNLEAITLAAKSGASLTKTNNKDFTPYELAQRRRGNKKNAFVQTLMSWLDPSDNEMDDDLEDAIRSGNVMQVKEHLCYRSSVHDKTCEGNTGLIVACNHGHESIADLMIHLGADVKARSTLGETALHFACQWKSPKGSADFARLLVHAGADVNARDKNNNTPLHSASLSGKTETLTLLITHRAGLNAKDIKSRTPLHHAHTAKRLEIMTQLIEAKAETGRVHQAVVRGDVDALMTLLQQGADVNQHDTSMGCSPLHAACLMGRTDIVTCLTQHGAMVDAVDQLKRTPLHHACGTYATGIVTCLIDHKAQVDAADHMKRTPLHYACNKGETDIVTFLLKHGAQVDVLDCAKKTPLHYACVAGHTHIAQHLINRGASVNSRDDRLFTPLHKTINNAELTLYLIEQCASVNTRGQHDITPLLIASTNGHTETALCLIKNSAYINAGDSCEATPLHKACEKGHTQTALCLLKHEASVDAQRDEDHTPLHDAEYCHTDRALCLVQQGVDVNAKDRDGCTPLHYACKNGHTETARCLIEQGADVNAKDQNGSTPLHCACGNDNNETAQCLIEQGAYVNVKDNDGSTPLHYACVNGDNKTVHCLLQHGANVNALSTTVFTPLHVACTYGHTLTVQLLLQHGTDVNSMSIFGTPLDIARRWCRRRQGVVGVLAKYNALTRLT